MSHPSPWFKQIPLWVWCAFIPTLGGLSIAYAGHKTRTSEWVYLGLGLCGAAIALGNYPIAAVIWIAQIGIAFSIKQKFLAKMLPSTQNYAAFADSQAARRIAEAHGKLDINTCSKDEMVRRLGLPIVYANDIDAIRVEGYMFTYVEELSEIAGLPENYLPRLQPLITFSYDIRKDDYLSWRRMNTCSIPELMAFGVTEETAGAIVNERLSRGDYKSVVDVKKRTGLPFRSYQSLM
jgi:DNA uptake protein ComE-like DNA-binding protein